MLRWPASLAVLILILVTLGQVSAQNTKGDKPAPNKKETRQTRFKVKSKQGDRAKTKDIAGRRLRTKNKSSANKANASYPQPRTATRTPRQGRDRAGTPTRPIYSSSPRNSERRNSAGKPPKRVQVRSVSAAASKRNVYPQKNVRSVSSQSSRRNVYSQRSNPYVNNASRKPKDPQGTSGSTPKRRVQVRSVTAKSSRQNVYSNRGNRYVNNPSRKPRNTQRASTRTASGRKVEVRSSSPISSKRISATPKSSSRAFIRHKGLNPFVGYFSVKKKEGDVSGKDLAGRPLLKRNFQSPTQAVIKPTIDPRSKKPRGDRAYKGPAAGSYKSATRKQPKAWIGDLAGRKIRGRNFESKKGGSNSSIYARKLSKARVGDHPKNKSISGFKSSSGKQGAKVGIPIPVKPPGKRAELTARYQNRLNGRRVLSGGGSVSGKKWNNNGQPITPRQPGIGIKGINYAGNLKASKPQKGGGSVSGKLWNNNGQPITPRQPGIGIRNINYAGNLKASKPQKGGGSVSGKLWNNNGQPITPRQPGIGIRNINYAGNLKASKPQKGGGSVSGKLWNNNGQPITPRQPGIGAKGINYAGTLKASKPEKGGGSVSGKLWNNNGQPINPRQPGIGIKNINYSGNIPATKPLKGGGSVSGKLWNNNGQPINKREPSKVGIQAATYKGTRGVGKIMVDQGETFTGFAKQHNFRKTPYQHESALLKREQKNAYKANGLQIKMLQPGWARNKNAHEDASLKKDPGGNVFRTDGLQIAIKSPGYKQNPNANEASILKRKPSQQTYLSNGIPIKIKQPGWARNKNAHEAALLKRDPSATVFATNAIYGKVKAYKYVRNPSSSSAALKVREPGKAFAKATNYQGNIKMQKFNFFKHPDYHPDSQFVKTNKNNVKGERDFLTSIRLFWVKNFRKNEAQPENIKEKVRKPRYDSREVGLWYD